MICIQQNEYSARIVVKCSNCTKHMEVHSNVKLIDGSVRLDCYCRECGKLFPVVVSG
jgi:hypothetical protein